MGDSNTKMNVYNSEIINKPHSQRILGTRLIMNQSVYV